MVNHAGEFGSPATQDRDQVLVVMAAGRDRELIASWLQGLSQYAVTTVTADDSIPETYDLCLLDPASLEAHRTTLEQRVEQSSPTYLPHLLLYADKQGAAPERDHEEIVSAEPVIDEVVALPMEKALLRQRIENLLRTRRSSVELSTREKQYRTLLEVLPEMVLLVEDDTIVYANETATRAFGDTTGAQTSAEGSGLEGCSVDTLATDEDRDVLRDLVASATNNNGNEASGFVNFTVESLDGDVLYVGATGLTVTFEGRTVTQLILRDLTSQKQREKRLTLFGRAIDAAAQGITIADAQQDDEPLIYANEAFERITGYPIDETLGRNCRFLQGPNTEEQTVTQVRNAVGSGKPVSVDILNYRNDGTAFWNRLDIVPIEDDDGTVTHFLGLQRDITDSKRSKQRLSVLNRILRHNLRNKVNVIQAYADQIERGETPLAESVDKINEAAEDLLTVGEHAREFDSVIATNHDEMQTVDLVSVVDTNLASLRADAPDSEVTVTAPESATIAVHPGLNAALSDLFVQLGQPDAPCSRIDISEDDEMTVLTIIDCGGALSEHDLEIIGYGVETPTKHLQGVELWLLRWAVERSRGEMAVTTDGEHPTITLRFPTGDDE